MTVKRSTWRWTAPVIALATWLTIPEAAPARPSSTAAGQERSAGETGRQTAERWAVGRGFLGVHVVEPTQELRRHLGAPEDTGVLISRVEAGSPAEVAGLQVGDVLASVDGAPIRSADALRREVASRREGERVDLEVYRSGRRHLLVARLQERRVATLDLFQGEEWEAFALRMAELGERIGAAGLAVGEEVGRRVAEELEAALERLMEPELRLRIEEELLRWEEEGLPRLEESLRELERRLQGLEGAPHT